MKIGCIFPGYGSQYVGMAKELYDEYRIIQEYFEEASNCLNQNFVKLIFASSEADLSSLSAAHESLFLVSCSIARVLKDEGIVPTLSAGFGQGDYAALCTAGAFTFPDGLYLIGKVAAFYESYIASQDLQAVLVSHVPDYIYGTGLDVAVYDLNNMHLVIGQSEHISSMLSNQSYTQKKIKYVPLESGLTASLFKEVVNQFKIYLEKVDFKDLNYPVIRGYDGHTITQGVQVKEYMLDRMIRPIRWPLVIDQFSQYDVILTIGPGTQQVDTLKAVYPDTLICAINKLEDIAFVKQQMGM